MKNKSHPSTLEKRVVTRSTPILGSTKESVNISESYIMSSLENKQLQLESLYTSVDDNKDLKSFCSIFRDGFEQKFIHLCSSNLSELMDKKEEIIKRKLLDGFSTKNAWILGILFDVVLEEQLEKCQDSEAKYNTDHVLMQIYYEPFVDQVVAYLMKINFNQITIEDKKNTLNKKIIMQLSSKLEYKEPCITLKNIDQLLQMGLVEMAKSKFEHLKHYNNNDGINEITLQEYENEINRKLRMKSYQDNVLISEENNIRFKFLKSILFAGVNHHWDAINNLSNLYLIDKEKYSACYTLADEIFKNYESKQLLIDKKKIKGLNAHSMKTSEIHFYLLFCDNAKAIKACDDYNVELKSAIEIMAERYKILEDSKRFENINTEIESDKLNTVQSNVANDDETFWMLSIDGGGIKGILPLYFLRELEIRSGVEVYNLFQMFSGTSIGGIIALILSQKKYSADLLLKKMMGPYKNMIFTEKCQYKYALGIRETIYDSSGLETLLLNEFGNQLTLKNSQGNYLITANINKISKNKKEIIKPCFFGRLNVKESNVSGLFKINVNDNTSFKKKDGFEYTQVYKIARATSAARPYFEEIKINDCKFIDGGYRVNNPSYLAYLFLTRNTSIKRENICMLSLGCNSDNTLKSVNQNSEIETSIDDDDEDDENNADVICFKRFTTIRTHLSIQIDALTKRNHIDAEKYLKENLNERYYRISPLSPITVELDGISKHEIWILTDSARTMVDSYDENDGRVDEIVTKLLFNYRARYRSCNNQLLKNDIKFRNRYLTRYHIYNEDYTELNEIMNQLNASKNEANSEIRIVELDKRLKKFNFKASGEAIVQPFTLRGPCNVCRSVAIGFLRSIDFLLKRKCETSAHYLNNHSCVNYWTPLHFAASNNELLR